MTDVHRVPRECVGCSRAARKKGSSWTKRARSGKVWHCYCAFHKGERCLLNNTRPISAELRRFALGLSDGFNLDTWLLEATFDPTLLTMCGICRRACVKAAQSEALENTGLCDSDADSETSEETEMGGRALELAALRLSINDVLDGNGLLAREVRDSGIIEVSLSPTRSALILARTQKPFEDLRTRQQDRRRAAVNSVLRFLRMDGEIGLATLLRKMRHVAEANSGTGESEQIGPVTPLRAKLRLLGKDEVLDRQLTQRTGPIAEVLTRGNWAVPLSPKQAAALAICRDLSERGLETIRRYVGAVPSLHKVRQARAALIKCCVPQVYCFDASGGVVTTSRARSVPSAGRKVESAGFDLDQCLRMHMQERFTEELSPPKPLRALRSAVGDEIFVCLLSIDGGTGTVKLMARVLLEGEPAHAMSSIFMISQAHGITESHADLQRCFGRYRAQIEAVESHGIEVNKPYAGGVKVLRWKFLFVSDYKVVYSMYGMLGARGSHPCPWCMWSARVMGLPPDEARSRLGAPQLGSRPPMIDLSDVNSPVMCSCRPAHAIQKAGTHDLFGLPMNAVLVPVLHAHLGIVNKILDVLDNAADEADAAWGRARDADSSISNGPEGDGEKRAARAHLARILSKYGVRRDRYFAGTLSGGPGTKMMRPSTMRAITEDFFYGELYTRGSPDGHDSIQKCLRTKVGVTPREILSVREALIDLSMLYGSDDLSASGGALRPLMMKNKQWTEADFQCWKELSVTFASVFNDKLRKQAGKEGVLRVPCEQPKMHALSTHLLEQAREYGNLSSLCEEGFEHLQQLSRHLREGHSGNRPRGVQIIDDLERVKLQSSCLVRRCVGGIEVMRRANGKQLRKMLFCPHQLVEVQDGDASDDNDVG